MAKEKDNRSFNPDITSVKESEAYKKEQAEKARKEKENQSRTERVKGVVHNGNVRFTIGLILLLSSVFLLIAFLSFVLGAGDSDQSQLAQGVINNAKNLGSVKNLAGSMGASLSESLIRDGFGLASVVLIIWSMTLGIRLMHRNKKAYFFSYTLISLFSLFAFSLIIGAATLYIDTPLSFPLGGEFGRQSNLLLEGLTGIYGMTAINVVVGVIWVMLCYTTLHSIWTSVKSRMPQRRKFNGDELDESEKELEKPITSTFPGDQGQGKRNPAAQPAPMPVQAPTQPERQPDRETPQPASQPAAQFVTQPVRKPAEQKPTPKPQGEQVGFEAQKMKPITTVRATEITNAKDPTGEFIHYRFPPMELLNDAKLKTDSVDVEEQETNKRRITETLEHYKIHIKSISVHVGPTVTLFEIVPADGVRISKIRGLEDDIALSLSALGIRIIAPMPGRGTIGIEVPNRDPQVVPIRQVLSSPAYQESKAKLPMALGCTVSNEVFVADLAKMPHLLVAGATGKGKSVGLNTILASLLYKKGPSELKIILIDPKRVEFSIYEDLEKYYFARVPGEDRSIITDTEKVVHALNCLVQEMENRYKVLEEVRVRKVEDYNKIWRESLRNVLDADGNKKYRYMPYIVCVIDEFSDMIMSAGKDVETPIVRIAQKARAVGIHMIIATQRPSAQVITGLIKGNFPGRMAFAVSQQIDSRIILDRSGAQQLIGRGDMLFQVDGEITRLQCPFIDTPEIVKICDFIKEQEDNDHILEHEQPYELPEYVVPTEGGGGEGSGAQNLNDRDPLFEEAAKWIVQSDIASTSSLQRRYQIGYNRAGRIMDQMEAAGIVGASQGGKPRKVLLSPMDIEQLFI